MRRLRYFYGARRGLAKALVALGTLVSIGTISVVTVGAVNALTTSSPVAVSSTASGSTSISRWIVPRDETTAPAVPTAGGAASGSGSFNAVSCPTATECVAVGGDGGLNGVASTSQNGGTTWKQGALEASEPDLNAVDCASASTCVAVGQGVAARSTDGGATWTSGTIPTSDTTLLGVSCPSTSLCVGVGVSPGDAGPYAGQLLVSSDGGVSWTTPTLPASTGALGSVDCPTTSFCVSVGASIVVSNDGGTTWTERTVSGGTGVLRSVSCASATTCVAIGANPSVAQDPTATAFEDVTTDGGATWSSVAMPVGSATLDVVSCSRGSCAAAGSTYNGTAAPILTSSNGGTSWTSNQSIPSSVTAVSAVSCSSSNACVFVGQSGGKPVAVPTGGGASGGPSPVSALVRTQKDVS
jgi:photosystem II stability/assembly factor-like uncharacterized protein